MRSRWRFSDRGKSLIRAASALRGWPNRPDRAGRHAIVLVVTILAVLPVPGVARLADPDERAVAVSRGGAAHDRHTHLEYPVFATTLVAAGCSAMR